MHHTYNQAQPEAVPNMFLTKDKLVIGAYLPHDQIKTLKVESKRFVERQTYATRQGGNEATLPCQ